MKHSFIKNGVISVNDAYRIVLMVDCIMDTLEQDDIDASELGMEEIWTIALATYQDYLDDTEKTDTEDAYPQDWYNNHIKHIDLLA